MKFLLFMIIAPLIICIPIFTQWMYMWRKRQKKRVIDHAIFACVILILAVWSAVLLQGKASCIVYIGSESLYRDSTPHIWDDTVTCKFAPTNTNPDTVTISYLPEWMK